MSDDVNQSQNLSERLHSVRVGVRAELEVTRQIFNGEPAYVVRDPISFHSFKFSTGDYQIFVALSDKEELGFTFERLAAAGVVDRDAEEDFYRFMIHLNQIGILTLPISDGKSLHERYVRRKSGELKSKILGAFFLRVPLVQPDEFLNRTIHWFRPLFSRWALALWVISAVVCLVAVFSRWQEFCDPMATMLTLRNLPLLWALMVGLKIFHELGHAYACKHFGGKVPEMGAYFIVLTPCAYVDASASWGFPRSRHRIVVALAGMYFESMLAMIALAIWAFTSPGSIHSAAQYAVILSTIVTLGFNANPLMKYDGYYVLSDLLGMPNLRGDAQKQLCVELKRVFYGVKSKSIATTRNARILMTLFGVFSSIYKVLVVIGISVVIAFKIPALGIGLAFFYVGQTLWQSCSRLFRYLRSSSELAEQRFRAVSVTAGLLTASIVFVLFVPIPSPVRTCGVVERTDDRIVRAHTAGFLLSTPLKNGQPIRRNDVICQLGNFDLSTEIIQKNSEIEQLEIQANSKLNVDLWAAKTTRTKVTHVAFDRKQLMTDLKHLTVRAPQDGWVTNVEHVKFLGRFVQRGEPLATISAGQLNITTLMTAENLSAACPAIGDEVLLMLPGNVDVVLTGTVTRIAAAGSRKIDDPGLTHLANGPITVSPESMLAKQPYFEVWIEVAKLDSLRVPYGSTILIKFPGRPATIGNFMYRRGLKLLNHLRMAGQ